MKGNAGGKSQRNEDGTGKLGEKKMKRSGWPPVKGRFTPFAVRKDREGSP